MGAVMADLEKTRRQVKLRFGDKCVPKCQFRKGKLILEQPIDRENVRHLLETGKTNKLTKFISKKKRPFSAFLTLGKDGKVDFEFEPREKKPAAPKGAKSDAAKPVEAKSA